MKINYVFSGETWKNKSTGEIVFVRDVRTSWSLKSDKETTTVIILGGTGKKRRDIILSRFLRSYEKIVPDYKSLIPGMIDLIINDPDSPLQKEVQKLARRLHPGGYFHEGCYVYIVSPIVLDPTDFRYGSNIDRSYLIEKITEDSSIPLLYNLELRSQYWNMGEKITVPMYLDRFIEIDAFTCLRRYDMPY